MVELDLDWEDRVSKCMEALELAQGWIAFEQETSEIVSNTLRLMNRINIAEATTKDKCEGLKVAYLELFKLRGGAVVRHGPASGKVREASRHLRDAIAIAAVSKCMEALELAQGWIAFEQETSEIVSKTLCLMNRVNIAETATKETCRGLVVAYLEVFKLRGGAVVRHGQASDKIREASRHLRDAIAITTYGNIEYDDKDNFCGLLAELSGRQIGAPGADGENLKSSLLKALHALLGVNLPSSEARKARKKRQSRSRAKKRQQQRLAIEQQAFLLQLYACSEQLPGSSSGSEQWLYACSEQWLGSSFSSEQWPTWPHEEPMKCSFETIHEADELEEGTIAFILEGEHSAAPQNHAARQTHQAEEFDVITDCDKLDPVVQGSDEVLVLESDALDLAQYARGSCLVVFGGPEDIRSGRNSDGSFLVRTNFKDLAENYLNTCPCWGGIYAGQVSIQKDASMRKLPKATDVSMIYTAAPQGPNVVNSSKGSEEGSDLSAEWRKDWCRFRDDVQKNIKNVLRACHTKDHREVVVMMADACFRDAPAAEIAAQWRECLLGPGCGDTLGLVRRLVFAMPFGRTLIRAKLAFQREFVDLNPLKPLCSCNIIVLGGTQLCVSARDLMKATEVSLSGAPNGIKVILEPISTTSALEHQLWLHLPCGRLVLAWYPELCLSAVSTESSDVCLLAWKEDVERQHSHLQIWRQNCDGTFGLFEHPKINLVTAAHTLCLEILPDATEKHVWQIMNAEQAIKQLL